MHHEKRSRRPSLHKLVLGNALRQQPFLRYRPLELLPHLFHLLAQHMNRPFNLGISELDLVERALGQYAVAEELDGEAGVVESCGCDCFVAFLCVAGDVCCFDRAL